MPTFVIQTLGKPASKVTVEKHEIYVGREATNDIVLPEDSVSRQHALVRREADGTWTVGCISTTNPIVVEGRLSRERLPLREGSELLVGSAFLLIFSEDPYKADQYINVKTVFRQSRCTGCQWEGMISTARKNATCPRCNGAAFVELGGYSGDAVRAAGASNPAPAKIGTVALDPASAQRAAWAIKSAKRSHVERVDEHAGATPRTELVEDKPLVLGRTADPMINLRGLCLGQVSIRWDGARWIAESGMIFPAMKINGAAVKSAPLAPGDEVSVGGNRFRFVTE